MVINLTKQINDMEDLIKVLKEIDKDFYAGIYTVGERYDLIKGINEVLKAKHFIKKHKQNGL